MNADEDPLLNLVARLAECPGVTDIVIQARGGLAVREWRAWRRLDLPVLPAERWSEVAARISPACGRPTQASEFCGKRWRVTRVSHLEGEEWVLRLVEPLDRTASDLGLPEELEQLFIDSDSGLFLIGGLTGMGKSTSLAALVQSRAAARGGRFILLEDPIERRYRSEPGAFFVQREVGVHCESVGTGVVEAMHQSPDVIVVQEIRDGPTAQAVLAAVATGHLVLATVHAGQAAAVPLRMLGLLGCDVAASAPVREALALQLQAIAVQRLEPASGGFSLSVEFLPFVRGGERQLSLEQAVRQGDWRALRQSAGEESLRAAARRNKGQVAV